MLPYPRRRGDLLKMVTLKALAVMCAALTISSMLLVVSRVPEATLLVLPSTPHARLLQEIVPAAGPAHTVRATTHCAGNRTLYLHAVRHPRRH